MLNMHCTLFMLYVQTLLYVHWPQCINRRKYIIYILSIRIVLARKTVSISEETHFELTKLGVYGETIDDIIKKCIDAYKKVNKK